MLLLNLSWVILLVASLVLVGPLFPGLLNGDTLLYALLVHLPLDLGVRGEV